MSNMQIDINPKKPFIWGPIEFRLIYGSIFINAILTDLEKYYPWPWPPTLLLFENGKIFFIMDDEKLKTTGGKYFKKYFLNESDFKKHWQKWSNWIKKYEKFYGEARKIKFKKLKDNDLYLWFKKFCELNIDFWLIVHVPEIANWGGEHFLKLKLKELYPEKFKEYLEILTASEKPSFFQEEEMSLLKLALIKDKKRQNEKIKEHSQKYQWLLNSYGGNRVLKQGYFKKRLTELIKKTTAENEINKIKNALKMNKNRKQLLNCPADIKFMADKLSESIWWQDFRKGYIWRLNYLLDIFIKELSERKNIEFKELLWCQAGELEKIFKCKKINIKEIAERRKYFALYASKNSLSEITDKNKLEKFKKIYLSSEEKKEIKEFQGLVVSKGNDKKITGRVKIISNPFTQFKNFKAGDILVAGMTSPEFVILMKKAKAIITDHGSMVCHAAIVSRELKKLCVVGAKIATQVLKNGDMVEVDAESGAIRKI
ncbi:MAG: PEP-utilizing enzyme [bacterium]